MAGYPGFNYIDSDKDFTDDVQRTMDAKFYGMTSEFANIHDGYIEKNHNASVVFGNGNNQQLPFSPQGNFEERVINYDAAAAYGRSANRPKSRVRRLVQLLPRLPPRVPSIPIPGAGYLGSILGKRRRDDCDDDWEHVVGPVDHPVKNLTNTNVHDWQRPPRKLRAWGLFQGKEDKSWTVDPRTGKRVQASPA
ncbi:hypothetical protein P171DRAFT_473677 [Karstenula rhodostoma CBS 690.94]|uniref:Uncharacterized protein n=1 Tax=Karstenula rhodostoma CBS 690.94 TaxID=1392251 RepID=A0A9P4PI91_9PLEO|nr:hypothetical protein P171DRAFT_473677 [Karstenula rhodostoma CBS 690.94]